MVPLTWVCRQRKLDNIDYEEDLKVGRGKVDLEAVGGQYSFVYMYESLRINKMSY